MLRNNGFLLLHLAVFLFGLSGVLGKLINLNAIEIVFFRTSVAYIFFLITFKLRKVKFNLFSNHLFSKIMIGLLLSIHWFCFFEAIKLAGVSLALLTFSSFPFFTGILEPIFFKENFSLKQLFLSIIIIFGLFLILPKFDPKDIQFIGSVYGILSGLSFAFLALMNRFLSRRISEEDLVLSQFFYASAFALIMNKGISFRIDLASFVYLILLGIFCTAIAHFSFIKSINILGARIASITSGLEPVYGIMFAVLLFDEKLEMQKIFGGIIIIISVIISGIVRKKAPRKELS